MDASKPESNAPFPAPRLVPDKVYEYASKWRDGLLTGERLPSGFLDNDATLRPYLESVAEGDEEGAIERLAWSVLAARVADGQAQDVRSRYGPFLDDNAVAYAGDVQGARPRVSRYR